MKKAEDCPIEIINSIKILIVNYLIGFLLIAFYWDDFFKLYGSIVSLLVNQFLSTIFISWIFYKIYKGKNWARVTWLVIVVFGTLFIFNSTFNSPLIPTGSKIHIVISTILNIVIFYIIFISPSRFWFSNNPDHSRFHYGNKSISNTDSLLLNNEKYWADALEEFEGPSRKPGLYARCFSHANGDENITKAEYLKIRTSELIESEKKFTSGSNNEALDDKNYNERNSDYFHENSFEDVLYRLYFFCKTPINAVFLIIIAVGIISFITAK
jgi:hypothetical protein